jgi:hypothetical protein
MIKAEQVFVRLGFSDQVVSLEEAYNNEKEICSCESYVIRYEDENGKECQVDGTYFDQVDPNQIHMFDD